MMVVEPDVAQQRGLQVLGAIVSPSGQHLGDTAIETLDHAVGLRRPKLGQTVLDAQGLAELVELVVASRLMAPGAEQPVGELKNADTASCGRFFMTRRRRIGRAQACAAARPAAPTSNFSTPRRGRTRLSYCTSSLSGTGQLRGIYRESHVADSRRSPPPRGEGQGRGKSLRGGKPLRPLPASPPSPRGRGSSWIVLGLTGCHRATGRRRA